MKLQTRYFDEVEIQKKEIIRFESGIPGFLDEKAFVVLPLGEGTPYMLLQSTETPGLAFVMVSPFVFFNDYEFKIPDPVVESLKLAREADVSVYTILTLSDPFEKSTANLRAPILINVSAQLGKQLVLNEGNYSTKEPLGIKASVGQEG